jgi:hypothetical protein
MKCIFLIFLLSLMAFSQTPQKSLFKQLPIINNNKKDTTDKIVDHFIINDPIDSMSTIEVTVMLKGSCGMEQFKGLQISYTMNKIGSGYGFCRNETNLLIMKMKNDKKVEMEIEEGSTKPQKNYKGCSFILSLVTGATAHARIEAKTPNATTSVVKEYGFPFEIKPYSLIAPKVIVPDKSLWKPNYIDYFKIYDLMCEEYFKIIIERAIREKLPCIRIIINHNENIFTLYITDKEHTVSNEYLFQQRSFRNKSWGPGPQYYKVFISKNSLRIVLKTKTGGKESSRKYKFANWSQAPEIK